MILTATLDKNVQAGDLVCRDNFTAIYADPRSCGSPTARWRAASLMADRYFGEGNYVIELRGEDIIFRRVR